MDLQLELDQQHTLLNEVSEWCRSLLLLRLTSRRSESVSKQLMKEECVGSSREELGAGGRT